MSSVGCSPTASRRFPQCARCGCRDSWAASSSRRRPSTHGGVVGCSAAAVRRGVLLRPLGDVVVLMPPLTVTSEEIHEIVHVLADAINEVAS